MAKATTKTAAKKTTTREADPEATVDDGLDALTDDELAARVTIETFADYDFDPEKVAAAIADNRDDVIANLRANASGDETPGPANTDPVVSTEEPWDDPEFPTRWHRDTYVENVNREISGAQARLDDIEGLPGAEITRSELKQMIVNARAELERLA